MRFGLIGDEAYYAIWSFHPALNYFDHSPSVAWVIWLGRTIFGESELAVRSMFLVADLIVCAALYRMAVVLFGSSPLSEEPRWRFSTGIASTTRRPTLATSDRQGRFATPRA